MKIDRLLSIIVILLNKDNITAKELANRFEVSVRTIYRDIETINLAGIPIVSSQGRDGGFSILDNYRMSHQLLTLDDMTSIIIALKNIGNFSENENIDITIDKISNIVPKDKKQEFDYHFNELIICDLPWGYRSNSKDKEKYRIIYEAIREERLVNIEYRDPYGKITERKIEPMSLVLKGLNWYVFSYCNSRNDYRFFRLSRIHKINILEKRFNRRDISYEEFKKQNTYINNMVELVLRFSPEVQQRVDEFFYEENIIIDEKGYTVVKISFPEDEWVYSMILSYGEYVEVLEPHYIKDIIKKKAQKIYEKY
ncbi:YafY family transcriptional regulator [Tissierella carlieri]|uniref:YafY family transcriptional regulator n=1 Tax=Tissierella carlieri TaxID=689904 RepID=A0ABT1SAA1_9FIRM|nr:YafY family protein [Tissierella carlieri]MCQ4922937.1 YafY family transcriptional regulator [Tissierella carlieri]